MAKTTILLSFQFFKKQRQIPRDFSGDRTVLRHKTSPFWKEQINGNWVVLRNGNECGKI